MLTIRCGNCKTKLFKYVKLGKGHVLRCHKARIDRLLQAARDENRLYCPKCGQTVGLDKGTYYSMVKGGFTYSGTKANKM